jgi:uncharacterized protein (DUF2126 family)/transglutaminase-like putative cysteine protease
MTIRVSLSHRTEYHYDRLVNLGPQTVRLRPAPHSRTPIPAYSLRVTPRNHFCNWQQDPHGNYQARLVFPEKVRRFTVEVDLVAEMTVINPFDFFLEEYAEKFPFEYDPVLTEEIAPFRRRLPATPLFQQYFQRIDKRPRSTVDFLVDLNSALQRDIAYVIRLEPGVQTPEETLEKRRGSCRDSAWLLVQLLRHLGFAARFASGYLIQLVADEKPLEGPAGPAADFTDLHAWTEVYLPGAGWVGLDPTSGLLTGEGHIPLACTPEPASAAPISGLVDEAEVDFKFHMEVTRIHEDPRVTKPYTEEQWQAITRLGGQIDRDLAAGDVRLTMGGEPTFVSIDNMEGAEWNTEALGEHKYALALDLFHRMRDRFTTGSLQHHGQGKWYPGEPLPRWAMSCFWRRDGQPLWRDQNLFADVRRSYGHDDPDAARFVRVLADRLAVGAEHAIPAYEDVFYYLWKERRLPTNVDPFDSKLADANERQRLARLFERGLDRVTGYALPLSKGWDGWGTQWTSGRWFLRSERMYLLPGDSPMGLRLPLDSLPWALEEDRPFVAEQDPFAPRDPLAPRAALSTPAQPRRAPAPPTAAEIAAATADLTGPRGQALPGSPTGPTADTNPGAPTAPRSIPGIVRTALCVEPRHGRLHVFLPPVRRLEDYIELVAAIEDTAAQLALPVVIEGYTPPHDPRLNHFKITPDPGVIEVNIHPAEDWSQVVSHTTGLYEDARHSRLGTEKFMLDGRHTGTGGGNHIVLGGPTPADSPFLRRPDLLRSLLAYWHNHPSLSYLFSSQFIGPTSQAPRVDEARNDAVYELEIAFRQIPTNTAVPPWLVDRVFRHLLVDVTGNTHRAEFCIDKLYSPDSPGGRLGLVEFRGFEMPPHARMSCTQQLLLRAFIAWFWNRPYEVPLVRWGTELHDRFMLPHFIRQDFTDVIADLRTAGYGFDADWFAPHFEFRFPRHGTVNVRDVEIELRQAIEPWLVLGEEPAGGAMARYVDSSVERLQVKVNGLVNSRHALTCNGRLVPLKSTGRVGEAVAGIRYRAWQPPSCLHPTIPVHTPLVFDLIDLWNNRSVGGCQYHVAHPGGRAFEVFPVNAFEAESRRATRFFPYGHTPGRITPPPAEPTREFPLTLDLRT